MYIAWKIYVNNMEKKFRWNFMEKLFLRKTCQLFSNNKGALILTTTKYTCLKPQLILQECTALSIQTDASWAATYRTTTTEERGMVAA